MDPVTHSLVGAALSRAGLQRVTPLATATLVLAANAPDIDILVSMRGAYATLAFRRGVTHGPLALLVLPLLVTALMLGYDRVWRRRARAAATSPAEFGAPPPGGRVRTRHHNAVEHARAGPLFGLALLGVLTHAPLDWLNTWGIRLLAPFSERWYYGDALFIIDPWIWLVLASVVVAHTRSRRARLGWFSLGFLAAGLALVTPEVPLPAKVGLTVGVVAVGLHAVIAQRRNVLPGERWARVALTAVALYIGAMIAVDAGARSETERAARAHGLDTEDVMVAPQPTNPFGADIVVQTPTAYQLGTFQWLASPRIRWSDSIPLGPRNAVVIETLRLQEVRDFLRWSRFPYVDIGEDSEGRFVRWRDARYPAQTRRGLGGITVRIEATPPASAPEN